ncbi:hypothetical protein EZS27_015595 [termite gut metagenome]|uniref:Uncharacterized protein n=1 Tax=termite gut metagenome TaxID=433724 RepID=A0A5J4RRU7_9ZZZZ
MVNLDSMSEQGIVMKNQKSASIKRHSNKPAFSKVNERYEYLLKNQVGEKSVEKKRLVVEECINRVDGISSTDYQIALRDTMTRLLFDFHFLKDCKALNIDPFSASQSIVILNKYGKVSKQGLVNVFKGKVDVLKDVVFSEGELAKAKYDTPAVKATSTQEKELSLFIEKATEILPKDESQKDE